MCGPCVRSQKSVHGIDDSASESSKFATVTEYQQAADDGVLDIVVGKGVENLKIK